MVIEQATFVKILEKTIGEIPDDVNEIYMHFKLISRHVALDEQVLFLSLCIFESRGFQLPEEPDPTRNPGDSDNEYLERLKYKGRGYIRLVGKEKYREAWWELPDPLINVFKHPFIISYSIENLFTVSVWIWISFVSPVLEKDSVTDKMGAATTALNLNYTPKQMNQCLVIYERAQKVMEQVKKDQ